MICEKCLKKIAYNEDFFWYDNHTPYCSKCYNEDAEEVPIGDSIKAAADQI